MRKLLVACLLIFPTTVLCSEKAYRKSETDYSVYVKKALEKDLPLKLLKTSPLHSATLYSDSESVMSPTKWRSLEDLQERFEKIRDERFLSRSSADNFPRRISWLYPKDGCWIRAALFNRNAFRLFVPIPDKVFAFGNLRVKSENSFRGAVTWWYHVAPIVQVGHEKYVLDPAINPDKPLTLKEWLGRMGTPEKIKIAICNSGTYSPKDDCSKKTDGMEIRAEAGQQHYLELERKQLLRLGRDPVEELGEMPPWRQPDQ